MPVTQLQRALLRSPGLFLADEDHKEPDEGTCSAVIPAASIGKRACAGRPHLLPQPHWVSHTGPPFSLLCNTSHYSQGLEHIFILSSRIDNCCEHP